MVSRRKSALFVQTNTNCTQAQWIFRSAGTRRVSLCLCVCVCLAVCVQGTYTERKTTQSKAFYFFLPQWISDSLTAGLFPICAPLTIFSLAVNTWPTLACFRSLGGGRNMGAGLSGVGGGGGSLGSSPVNPMLNRIKYFFASRSSTFDDIWNVCANLSEEIGEQVLDVFCLTL